MVMTAGLRRALKGLSEAAFRERFGTEEACRKALFEMRWREGLICPGCGHRGLCQLKTRELFQPGFPRWPGFRLPSYPAFDRKVRSLRGGGWLPLLSPVASDAVRSPVSA